MNRFENIRNETNLGTYFAYFKKGSFNNSIDLLYNQESDGYCSGIINYDSSNRNKITEPLPKIIDKLAGVFSFNNLSKINSGASVAFKPYLFFNLANPNPKVLSILADSSAYGVRNGNLRLSGGKNGSEGLVGVIKTKGIKYISATLTVSDTAQYPNLFAVPYKNGLPVTDAQDSWH